MCNTNVSHRKLAQTSSYRSNLCTLMRCGTNKYYSHSKCVWSGESLTSMRIQACFLSCVKWTNPSLNQCVKELNIKEEDLKFVIILIQSLYPLVTAPEWKLKVQIKFWTGMIITFLLWSNVKAACCVWMVTNVNPNVLEPRLHMQLSL